jgi:hypothetical protein
MPRAPTEPTAVVTPLLVAPARSAISSPADLSYPFPELCHHRLRLAAPRPPLPLRRASPHPSVLTHRVSLGILPIPKPEKPAPEPEKPEPAVPEVLFG